MPAFLWRVHPRRCAEAKVLARLPVTRSNTLEAIGFLSESDLLPLSLGAGEKRCRLPLNDQKPGVCDITG